MGFANKILRYIRICSFIFTWICFALWIMFRHNNDWVEKYDLISEILGGKILLYGVVLNIVIFFILTILFESGLGRVVKAFAPKITVGMVKDAVIDELGKPTATSDFNDVLGMVKGASISSNMYSQAMSLEHCLFKTRYGAYSIHFENEKVTKVKFTDNKTEKT